MDINDIKQEVETRIKGKGYGNWDENLWAKIDDIMGLGYSSKYPDIWSIYPDIAEIEKIYNSVPSKPNAGSIKITGNPSGQVHAAIGHFLDVIKSVNSTGAVNSHGSTGTAIVSTSAGYSGSSSGSVVLSTIESNCLKLLKANHNIILSGAPGTGKTYMAHKIALAMTGNDEDKISFVQFHPSYDYTDFVEGLRPTPPSGSSIGFKYMEGIFRTFCKQALTNSVTPIPGMTAIPSSIIVREYDKLLVDIKNGSVTSISTKTNGVMDATVKDGIVLKTHSTNKDYSVSRDKIEKLSKAYPSKESLNKIKNIDKEIRKVIGGVHSSAVWAVLNEIYRRLENEDANREIEMNDNNNYVFIIDEINRGEMSKVFGELFFSIDPGYRGTKGKVRTQYANMVINPNPFDVALSVTDPNNYGHFFVPENVYIIGTMNDIDRSVDTMDFAMRRRFLIKEIKAKDTQDAMLRDLTAIKEINSSVAAIEPLVIDKMDALNEIIEKRVVKIKGTEYKLHARLGSSYSLGASYFQKYYKYNNYDDLWTNHIEGILREYLRGTSKPDDDLEVLKNVYTNA